MRFRERALALLLGAGALAGFGFGFASMRCHAHERRAAWEHHVAEVCVDAARGDRSYARPRE